MSEKNNIFVAAFFTRTQFFGHLKIKENINLMVEGLRMELKQRILIYGYTTDFTTKFFLLRGFIWSVFSWKLEFYLFQRNFIDESAQKVMMLLTLTTLNKLNSLFGSKNGKYGSWRQILAWRTSTKCLTLTSNKKNSKMKKNRNWKIYAVKGFFDVYIHFASKADEYTVNGER